jgi:hypothetical protein
VPQAIFEHAITAFDQPISVGVFDEYEPKQIISTARGDDYFLERTSSPRAQSMFDEQRDP